MKTDEVFLAHIQSPSSGCTGASHQRNLLWFVAHILAVRVCSCLCKHRHHHYTGPSRGKVWHFLNCLRLSSACEESSRPPHSVASVQKIESTEVKMDIWNKKYKRLVFNGRFLWNHMSALMRWSEDKSGWWFWIHESQVSAALARDIKAWIWPGISCQQEELQRQTGRCTSKFTCMCIRISLHYK